MSAQLDALNTLSHAEDLLRDLRRETDEDYATQATRAAACCTAFVAMGDQFLRALEEYAARAGFLEKIALRTGRAQANKMRENMLMWRGEFSRMATGQHRGALDIEYPAKMEMFQHYAVATLDFFEGAINRMPQ